MKFMTTSDE